MSQDRHQKGKITRVTLKEGQTDEDFAREFLKGKKDPFFDDFLEELMEEHYKEFILIHDELYHLVEEDTTSTLHAKLNDDGSIDFDVKYYDGGASLEEAIEAALRNLPYERN